VNAVAVFADGNRVVSGSHDKTVKIWELPKLIGLTQSAQSAFDSSDLGDILPYDLQQKIFEMAKHKSRQRGLLTRKEDTKRQERKDYDEELRRMELLDRRRWSGGAGANQNNQNNQNNQYNPDNQNLVNLQLEQQILNNALARRQARIAQVAAWRNNPAQNPQNN